MTGQMEEIYASPRGYALTRYSKVKRHTEWPANFAYNISAQGNVADKGDGVQVQQNKVSLSKFESFWLVLAPKLPWSVIIITADTL